MHLLQLLLSRTIYQQCVALLRAIRNKFLDYDFRFIQIFGPGFGFKSLFGFGSGSELCFRFGLVLADPFTTRWCTTCNRGAS